MEFYTMTTETAEQDLKEIIASLPEASVEKLDEIGFRVETQHMFAVMGRSEQSVIDSLYRLLTAVNNELKRRGIPIRPQDRKG